jgi:predicted outer membrane repeat protein
MEFGSEHRKRRWYQVAVGGLIGASGLAAVGVVAAVGPATGLSGLADVHGLASQSIARPAADGGSDDAADDRRDGKDGNEDVREVPCDSDELIEAIVRANAKGGQKLELDPKCTYTLTAFDDTDGRSGLPEIEERVSINGHGATIVRAANAESFRIFTVGDGGNLTLRDLTVKGGDTRSDQGGGGLLVREGGRATVEDSTFTLNRSSSNGGAIANRGVTRILGEEDRKDDPKDDGKKDDHGDDYGDDSWSGKDGVDTGKDGVRDGATEITNNSAEDNGGAIYNVGSLTVEDARLDRNSADLGGALANFRGVARLTDTEVDSNHALTAGGGVFTINSGTITEIKDSALTDNTAGNDGGGLWNGASTTYVRDSEVKHNAAVDDGGGAFNIGGEVVVDKSEINENKALAGDGGGVFNGGDFVLRDSEVKENTAFGDDAVGGGIANVANGRLTLRDTRVVENASTEPPGGIATTNDNVFVDDESTIIKNRPTNCADGPEFEEVPNCFG